MECPKCIHLIENESNMKDKEILITVNKAIMASPDLRNKKDLIEEFIFKPADCNCRFYLIRNVTCDPFYHKSLNFRNPEKEGKKGRDQQQYTDQDHQILKRFFNSFEHSKTRKKSIFKLTLNIRKNQSSPWESLYLP